MEDFHGSSELFKVATKVITFAIGKNTSKKTFLSPTYFRIDKCRLSGNVSRYIGKVNYNLRMNDYEQEYELGELSSDEVKFELVEKENYPARVREILRQDDGYEED